MDFFDKAVQSSRTAEKTLLATIGIDDSMPILVTTPEGSILTAINMGGLYRLVRADGQHVAYCDAYNLIKLYGEGYSIANSTDKIA